MQVVFVESPSFQIVTLEKVEQLKTYDKLKELVCAKRHNSWCR